MPVRVLGFDGDDTLWHSETRFHVTQAEFRDLLHRHVPDADVDTPLAEMEMKNLAIYG
jgi:putative hydrolase of the HAD superfamily